MFWRWRPLRRDGRIDPFTLTAAYVGPVFFSLPLLIFFPFPSPFPCLDNLLPRTPYTSILSTYVYFRVRSSSFLTVIGSLPSRPFYSFASSLFARLFFNLRRNAFHEANARRIRGGFFFFFRKMKRTGGFWMEMFDPDKRSLIVSCTFLRFVFDGTNTFRDAGHISDRDRNSFMGT